jgi:hypothetical protein
MPTQILPAAVAKLQRRVADGFRTYMAHEGAERTLAAKDIADAIMEARAMFQARDGSPDLLGRSADYRAFIAGAQDLAGVPKSLRPTIMAAVRYHVSTLLRERYSEEVGALGLSPESAVDRARRRKEQDTRILALFAGGSELEDPSELSRVASLARLGVSRVAGWPPGTTEAQRKRIRAEFDNLADAVAGAVDRLS